MSKLGWRVGFVVTALTTLTAGCTAIDGLDGLVVVGASPDGPRGPGDSGLLDDAAVAIDGSPGHTPSVDAADASASSLDATTFDAEPVDTGKPEVDGSVAADGGVAADGSVSSGATCIPLGVQPCAGNENCLVVNDPNDLDPPSACVQEQGAGLTEGQACNNGSECAVGLDCLGEPDAGSYSCAWMCYDAVGTLVLGPPPFDAGELGTEPGKGGCPAFETCTEVVTGYPTWLGACTGM